MPEQVRSDWKKGALRVSAPLREPQLPVQPSRGGPVTLNGLSFADPPAGLVALFALLDDCCAILSLRSGPFAY